MKSEERKTFSQGPKPFPRSGPRFPKQLRYFSEKSILKLVTNVEKHLENHSESSSLQLPPFCFTCPQILTV